MNKRIYGFSMDKNSKKVKKTKKADKGKEDLPGESLKNKGEAIYDATVFPQKTTYRTDLELLNTAREINEEIIDLLHSKKPDGTKPRTYLVTARKSFLKVAQNKNLSKKTIRGGIKAQLQYLRRNFKTIENQLDQLEDLPLKPTLQRKYWVIHTVYAQQLEMYEKRTYQMDDRIVSIDQPHVRPMVLGKARSKTGFGTKIHLSQVDGYSFWDTISWCAFNEGSSLKEYVENYRQRFGFYSEKVLVNKIYFIREN